MASSSWTPTIGSWTSTLHACAYLGLPKWEAVGRPLTRTLAAPASLAALEEEPCDRQFEISLENSRRRDLEVRISPLYDRRYRTPLRQPDRPA